MGYLPNIANVLAGMMIIGAGTLFGAQVAQSFGGNRKSDDFGYEFTLNSVRAVASAYCLIGMWIGIRVTQTARVPEWWQHVAEMGWMYLVASALGSVFFLRGSWLARFQLAFSIVGLAAMAYVNNHG